MEKSMEGVFIEGFVDQTWPYTSLEPTEAGEPVQWTLEELRMGEEIVMDSQWDIPSENVSKRKDSR